MPKHEPEVSARNTQAALAEFKRMVKEKPEIRKMQKAITGLRDSLRKRLGKKVVVDEMLEITLSMLFSYVYGRRFEHIGQIIQIFARVDACFHEKHEAAVLASMELMKGSDDQ